MLELTHAGLGLAEGLGVTGGRAGSTALPGSRSAVSFKNILMSNAWTSCCYPGTCKRMLELTHGAHGLAEGLGVTGGRTGSTALPGSRSAVFSKTFSVREFELIRRRLARMRNAMVHNRMVSLRSLRSFLLMK